MEYHYVPLDKTQKQIRLLHLLPAARFEDEIRCTFILASLDNGCILFPPKNKNGYLLITLKYSVKFEALSYVWGDAFEDLQNIYLEYRSKPITKDLFPALKHPHFPTHEQIVWASKHIQKSNRRRVSKSITKNLYAALKHLRLPDRERILWVDALCIDQTESTERTHQVRLMASIYGQASTVLIWLGEAFKGSDLAIEIVERWARNEDLHFDQVCKPTIDNNSLGFDIHQLVNCIIQLFDVPWFKRLW